jgi:hypothetical protein
MAPKTVLFQLRLTPAERRKLRVLAKRVKSTSSDVVRRLITAARS